MSIRNQTLDYYNKISPRLSYPIFFHHSLNLSPRLSSCSHRRFWNIKRKRWVVNAKMQRYTIWQSHYLKSTVELRMLRRRGVVWVIKSERFAQGLWGLRDCSQAGLWSNPSSKCALISHEYGESIAEVTIVLHHLIVVLQAGIRCDYVRASAWSIKVRDICIPI